MAAVRQGCPPFLGVLQHQFQPFPEPLAGDCSRAFALAPGQHTDQHSMASEGLHTPRGPAGGQAGPGTCHPATWSGWRACPCKSGPDKMWSTRKGNGKPLQYSCLENPMNTMKRQIDMTMKEEPSRSVGIHYANGEEQRKQFRENEEAEPKANNAQLWMCLVVKVRSDAVKKHYIGTWNVQSMNRGKLDVVKQKMAKANIDILGISELKWKGMDKFNSDDHYINYCGRESLRRSGVALIVNKRVQNAVLGCNLKNNRMISVNFQDKSFNITIIQV